MNEYNCKRLIIVIPSVITNEFEDYWKKITLNKNIDNNDVIICKKDEKDEDYLAVFNIGKNKKIEKEIDFSFINDNKNDNKIKIKFDNSQYTFQFENIILLLHEGLENKSGNENIKFNGTSIDNNIDSLKQEIEKRKGVLARPSSSVSPYNSILENCTNPDIFNIIWNNYFYDQKKRSLLTIILSILIDLKGLEYCYKNKNNKMGDYFKESIDDNDRFNKLNTKKDELKPYINNLENNLPDFKNIIERLKTKHEQKETLDFKVNNMNLDDYWKEIVSLLG